MRLHHRILAGLLITGVLLAACGAPQPTLPPLVGPTATDTQPAPEASPTQADSATPTATLEPTSSPTPAAPPTETLMPTATPIAEMPPVEPLALTMIAALNRWRIDNDRLPFRFNDKLQAAALDQMDFLLSRRTIPDGPEIHVGRFGEDSPERARRFGWPNYATDRQTAAGEIACLNDSASACINWWLSSTPHYKTMSNRGFREIGVATARFSYGEFYIVMVGSQPGVFPALVDPLNASIYLSREEFALAGGGNALTDVTAYQLLAPDQPAPSDTAWKPYVRSAPLPSSLNGSFLVVYTDGSRTVSITVNPLVDVVWLPETLRALATPTPVPTATLPPTATPTQPTLTPTAVPPTLTPSPTPLQGDVLLDYSEAGTLLLRNIAGSPVDLTGLVLRQGDRQMAATSWQSFMLSTNLAQFPAGGCIRLWAAVEPPRGQPAGCGWPNAGITIPPQDRVWMGGAFEAVWQDAVIETCPPAPDRCVLDLPG